MKKNKLFLLLTMPTSVTIITMPFLVAACNDKNTDPKPAPELSADPGTSNPGTSNPGTSNPGT
ncbi:hypothetical protein, partial [Mycoplasma sp. 2634B]